MIKWILPLVLAAHILGAQTNPHLKRAKQQASQSQSKTQEKSTEREAQLVVYFGFDKDVLTPEAKAGLDEWMKKRKPQEMSVACHCDQFGSEEYNLDLSLRRAQSVARYLQSKNWDESMIRLYYFGKARPIYEETSAKRHLNRRCEIQAPPAPLGADLKAFFATVPPSRGKKFTLPNLEFVGNQVIPQPEGFLVLEYLLGFMNQYKDLGIQLEGHVCCSNNKDLSKNRAEMVAEFLRFHGIDNHRLASKGFGNTKPLAEETNDENRQLNRRVEVLITHGNAGKGSSVAPVEVDTFYFVVNGVDFYPNRDYLFPKSDHYIRPIAESIAASADWQYTFVIFERQNRQTIKDKRAKSLRVALRKAGAKEGYDVMVGEEDRRFNTRGKDLILVKVSRRQNNIP